MSFPLIGKIFKNKNRELLQKIESRLQVIEDLQELIIAELGETAVHCDRCGSLDDNCFKCNRTGVIKRKQLFSWPFI
jgi:hypothetical protein